MSEFSIQMILLLNRISWQSLWIRQSDKTNEADKNNIVPLKKKKKKE
jgi:hypothetical protein